MVVVSAAAVERTKIGGLEIELGWADNDIPKSIFPAKAGRCIVNCKQKFFRCVLVNKDRVTGNHDVKIKKVRTLCCALPQGYRQCAQGCGI